jgi:hypothetical protein
MFLKIMEKQVTDNHTMKSSVIYITKHYAHLFKQNMENKNHKA